MACEDLIQFDIEAVTSSISNKYSMLQFINQQNYEQMKLNYSANFPEYFSGDYNQFKQQRNELTKLFIAAGYSNVQTSAYRRTMSATSAAAYAKCLAENSHKPISAWVEEYSEDKIFINIRNGLREDVSYQVLGETPTKANGVLTGGGTQALQFNYDPNQSFLVAINAVGKESGIQDTTIVELEKIRRFEVRKTQKELTATFTCGAGGYGNPTKNGMSSDAVFVADQDYYLLYDTRKVIHSEVLGGPGLLKYELDWITEGDPAARPRRIIAHPRDMVGNSADTQGIIIVTCSIIAEREYLVEVLPTAVAEPS